MTELNFHIKNTRALIGWDVPTVSHLALGTGEVGKLVDKPANWANVYMAGYENSSLVLNGKLSPRSQKFLDRVKGKIELPASVQWWVTCMVDVINLFTKAVAQTDSTEADAFIGYFITIKKTLACSETTASRRGSKKPTQLQRS